MTHWFEEYRCESCRTVLTYNQKYKSLGVCPYCGTRKDRWHSTFAVATTNEIVRYVYAGTWWKPWTWSCYRREVKT